MYYRRKIVLTIAAMVSMVALGGCSATTGANGAGANSEGEAFTLKLGMEVATTAPLYAGAEKFKEILEQSSEGRITVEIFPSSQLGSENQMMGQVSSGALDIVTTSPAGASNLYPDAAILAFPYVLNGDDEASHYASLVKASNSDVVAEMTEEMAAETGIRVLDWTWWYGDRHITNSVGPINTVADIEGLKLRVPDAPIYFMAPKALGAAVTPLAFAELYLALGTGTVDGQENPLAVIESQKFFEVQDHLALTGHMSQAQLFAFSEDVWSGISAADQALIAEAAKQGGVFTSELTIEQNNAALNRLEEAGMKITNPDVAELRKAVAGAAEEWAESNSDFNLDRYEAFVAAQN